MGNGVPAYGGGVHHYGQAFLNITQAPRWRGLIIGTISLLLVLSIWKANTDPEAPGRRLYHKISGKSNHQDFMWKPPSDLEPSEITLDLGSGDKPAAPGHLKKENPQFHLLVHAPIVTSNVCRSLLSSFLLGYPPPTLVGYRPSLSMHNNTAAPNFLLENGIPDVADFLSSQPRVQDDDYLLLVEGESSVFQLPIEALLETYNLQFAAANKRLEKEYHDIPVQTFTKQKLQRFNQSVFFAAEYEIVPLPRKPFLSRFKLSEPAQAAPVHLNNDLLLGSGLGVRRLFTTAAEQNTRIERTDSATFNTMYAQQALLRDSKAKELRKVKSWLGRNVLSTDHKSKKAIAEDYTAAKQDLGVGLDLQGTMFQSIPSEARDVTATMIRLNESESFPAPPVFNKLNSPFDLQSSTPHLNSTSAVLTQKHSSTLPSHETWTTVPLFTNPRTLQIPSVISIHPSATKDDAALKTAPDTNVKDLWQSMWFYPHARALLKQYLTKSTSKETASEAAVGGERWWDARGGRGGAWTAEGEWLDAAELCAPFGSEIFKDGLRGWPHAVPEGVELDEHGKEKGPGGRGEVIGEMVSGNEVVKVVLVPPTGA